jgi:molybdopterin biosynthesis enzyme
MRSETGLGDVPHFDVATLDGLHVRYRDIWQRRNLVLVVVRPDARESAASYASQLRRRRDEFERGETTVVVTSDVVPGVSPSTVVVADRWGEITYRETFADAEFPDIDELLSWVHFIQIQCPECPP